MFAKPMPSGHTLSFLLEKERFIGEPQGGSTTWVNLPPIVSRLDPWAAVYLMVFERNQQEAAQDPSPGTLVTNSIINSSDKTLSLSECSRSLCAVIDWELQCMAATMLPFLFPVSFPARLSRRLLPFTPVSHSLFSVSSMVLGLVSVSEYSIANESDITVQLLHPAESPQANCPQHLHPGNAVTEANFPFHGPFSFIFFKFLSRKENTLETISQLDLFHFNKGSIYSESSA